MSQPRQTDHAIHPLFINRWSPRAFTGESIDQPTLDSLFEAARWAPSANNSQPWRFIYARNGSAHWPELLELLNEKNRAWASNASVLIVLVSKTTHLRAGSDAATALRNHSLDAGAAWAHLALQAEHAGWHSHAIGGFDREQARTVLGVPDGYQVEIAIAIGKLASRDSLSAELQAREQPNQRNPLHSLIAEGRFSFQE
jgi:nitroreductase